MLKKQHPHRNARVYPTWHMLVKYQDKVRQALCPILRMLGLDKF